MIRERTNFVSEIFVSKTGSQASNFIGNVADIILWYSKKKEVTKFRSIYNERENRVASDFSPDPIKSAGNSNNEEESFVFEGKTYKTGLNDHWKTHTEGMIRLYKTDRITSLRSSMRYKRYFQDYPVKPMSNFWTDLGGAANIIYVVQTSIRMIERCLLMTTDPGDLVLDPTCGSGTTAFVAEQWGRRWITIDTSRVALALARARIMGARYPYFLLADSREGQMKEAELSRTAPSRTVTGGDIRHGFVYERVPHITLKSIANNAEIDSIWEAHQPAVLAALAALNAALRGHDKPFPVTVGGRAGQTVCFDAPEGETVTLPSGEVAPVYELLEWEVPREGPADWPKETERPLAEFWKARINRQREMDKSIAARADFEYLYDKPFEDKGAVRVAGPFTVETLSPHRVMGLDETKASEPEAGGLPEVCVMHGKTWDFAQMVLENLRTAGVQQAHKEDRITFISLTGWPGSYICAEGTYREDDARDDAGDDAGDDKYSGPEKRAGIFIGPEFGTVSRADLAAAAREALAVGFNVLIACAFNYDAHASEFNKLGPIPILKARMNADLHMAGDLKNTGQGNLFVIFGEPDVELLEEGDEIRIRILGVDVFDPRTGQVRADEPDGIACWFIDTNYDEESFFIRHAYFLGAANDPYQALKRTLKSEIDEDAWATLQSDTSRPFSKPESGRVAVKVINHLGDEVMKVIKV